MTLTAGQDSTGNDFTIQGAQTDVISLRMFLASTGTLSQFLTGLHNAPSVQASGSSSTTTGGNIGPAIAYTTGNAGTSIASGVTIASPDSPTLASMTATIENLADGSSETLSADTAGTTLTSDYANGVLTVSGVASVATYKTVLDSLEYSDTATPGTGGSRTVSIVVNDGTDTSPVATVTVTVTESTSSAPTVTTNPTSAMANLGGTVTFTAAASGIPTPTVQWEVNTGSGYTDVSDTGVYSGATTDKLTITGATATMNDYQYEAVFTNSVSSATTTAATLTVDSVTTQPASQTVNAGTSVTFTAATSNPSGKDTVQWEVSSDGGTTFTDISGAAATSYSFATTAADNGDEYEAVFTTSAGTLTSNAAALTVDFAPAVTTNPTSQLVEAGSTIDLKAAASGSPTPTVQWKVSSDGGTTFTNIFSATSTSYSFTPTASNNGDEYEAVFTNSIGSATTTAATLTVDSITTQPASQTVDAGASVTFTAASSDSSGDTVQWKVSSNGGTTFTNISGATSTSYTFTAAGAQNGDEYEAVFTNTAGTLTSDAATLTVQFPPAVTTNPASQLGNAGSTVTFTAAASGNPTPTVQWKVSSDGGTTFTNISGATSTSYSFTPTATQSGDEYEAVFTNTYGSVTTSAATLTVDSIATQPVSQTADTGKSVTLTAASSNGSGDTVQWEVESEGGTAFSPISGATSTTYTFTTSGTENGDEYEAVFGNSAGKLASDPATLTVDYVTTQPASQTVDAGAAVTFTADSSNPGTENDTVQWQMSTDGGTTFTKITGATSTTYGFTASSTQNGNEYEAVFTNSLGSFTSNAATLTVDYAPTVTTNPTASTLVDAGSTVTLTAAATGNPAPTVQWDVSTDGGTTFAKITGATSTTYSFTASGTQNGDEYEAVFTNSVGAATTTAASLTVDYVTTQPATQTVDAGATVTLTAASTGGSGDSVQWKVSTSGGTTFSDISGATSTSFSFTAAATQTGNEYEAVFSNSAGTVTSGAATLTVDYAPTVTTNPAVPTVVDAGNTVTLTAAATGNPAPTVQWKVSGDGGTTFTNISGATSTSYSFTAAATQSGNEYEAVFTNSVNSATTSAATLTIDAVTTQPASQTVDGGASVTFTAASTDGSSDSVQWKVSTDGGTTFSDISGATSTTYSFTAAASQNGDEYQAVFTNSGGTLTSDSATLTVDFAPTVSTNPTLPTTVDAGSSVTLEAAASGNPAPAVQWKVSTDGGTTFTNISGATSTSYSFTPTATQSGDEYEAVFTNSIGAATTTPATLTIDSVTTQPANQAISTGGDATFTAASANSSDAVQWKVNTGSGTFAAVSNGGVYSNATTKSLTITDATAAMNGYQYEAVFTNSSGSVTSNPATLTVGYSIAVDQSTYNLVNGADAGFTFTSIPADVGDTMTYLVAGDLTGYVLKSVQITSTSQHIGNINLTNYDSTETTSQITFSAWLTINGARPQCRGLCHAGQGGAARVQHHPDLRDARRLLRGQRRRQVQQCGGRRHVFLHRRQRRHGDGQPGHVGERNRRGHGDRGRADRSHQPLRLGARQSHLHRDVDQFRR